jgi:hypothetical protein
VTHSGEPGQFFMLWQYFTTSVDTIQPLFKKIVSPPKRLFQPFRHNKIDENLVLDKMNKVKTDRQTDKQNLESHIKAKELIEHLMNTEVKLSYYCQRLRHDLYSASYQDKCEIFDMLKIKVMTTTEAVQYRLCYANQRYIQEVIG